MASVRKAYLLLYNVFQAAGWALALYQVIDGSIKTQSLSGAYAAAGNTIGM